MKYKVLISAPYMAREREKIDKWLKEYPFDVDWAKVEERLEESDLLSIIGKYEAILCGDDRITDKVIDAATNLRAIVKWGTGIDSINKEYAEAKGIKVYRTLNAFTEPVSDTTIGKMLNEVRNIARNDRIVKSGGWDKPISYTLGERTIGIIGFGNIGRAVARKLIPFGPKVLVNDIVALAPSILEEHKVRLASKEEIYEQCDIITLHCDLNPTSQYLFNAEAFDKMKRRPYIINTARGPLIKEQDLIVALEQGLVSGAGIDVFEFEPLSVDHPLRKMENVTAACHNSNSSPHYWDKIHKNSLNMMLEGLKSDHE